MWSSVTCAVALCATISCATPEDDPGLFSSALSGVVVNLYGGSVVPAPSTERGVEVGVRVTTDTRGSAIGVRFYKGAGNDGPHTGHLWTAGGVLLASVEFTGETATGWQHAAFATPVELTPDVVYVASYRSTTGYAYTPGGLTVALDRAPLHVPALGGVFALGPDPAFPATSVGASYGVDVDFDVEIEAPPPPPPPPVVVADAWVPRACGARVQCVAAGTSIQAAVDRAATGDVIQVAAGSYGGVRVAGKALTLIGGLTADFLAWDPVANPTILSASGRSVVRLESPGGTWLQGFTIRGGTGTCAYGRCEGGGVFATGGAYTIVGNVIESNDVGASGQGGGINVKGSGAIRGNLIRDNRGGRGAGVATNAPGLLTIAKNVIEGNRSLGDHGGGMYLGGTDLVITDNVLRDNTTGAPGWGWGGGATILGTTTRARLARNVFTANAAPNRGSGLFIDDDAIVTSEGDLFYRNACTKEGGVAIYVDGLTVGAQLTLVNATITDNDCPLVGRHSAVHVTRRSTLTVRNSIAWATGRPFDRDVDSTIAVSYSLLEAAQPGLGNLIGDPLFASPATGDFNVRSTGGRLDPATGTFVRDAVTSPSIDRAAPGDAYDQESSPNGSRRNLGHTGNTAGASRSP